MKDLRLFVATASVALVIIAPGCKRESGGSMKTQRPDATAVTVAAVTNIASAKTVSTVDTLFTKDEAAIAAQVEAAVERTLVDFGDRVRSNQDLAFIDTASYEAQLEQAVGNLAKAEANLTNARLNFERVEKLRTNDIASASDFDQAKAQRDQWDADVKGAHAAEGVARLNLQRSRVQAPFDGAIAQRIVGRGDYVKVGSPLFNIVNDAVLKFIFQVPERYASYVEKKLPATFRVDNYPGETFTGSVYLISPAVNTASRAFNVGALVTNTDFRLKANTFGRGELVLDRGLPTPVGPLESVISVVGVTKVFVVQDSVAHDHTVKTGRIRDGLQEILDGVKLGEVVVVTGQSRLNDGSTVSIRKVDALGPKGIVKSSSDNKSAAASHDESR